MYSTQLLDHFQNPRNAGRLTEANARARRENPVCGDIMEIALVVEGDVIREVRFLAKGCVASIACGSALTELARGASIAVASQLTRNDVEASLGGLEGPSTHAAQLALETLRAAVDQLKQH